LCSEIRRKFNLQTKLVINGRRTSFTADVETVKKYFKEKN
jgi:hypothetical protein